MNTPDKVRVAQRIHLTTKVEFYVDADLIDAESVDISESGIRFETAEPLKFRMKYIHEDDSEEDSIKEREAQLVWAKTEEDGCMTYGLKFIADDDSNLHQKISTAIKDETQENW